MAGLMEPIQVTAYLQQGLVFDPRHGLALDGLLASALRAEGAKGSPGSLLDGGLGLDEPTIWEVPLEVCKTAPEPLWHWMATAGQLLSHDGLPVPMTPDPHRLLQSLDEVRARQVAIRQPKHVGGPRGRFRARGTPVLAIPAARVVWHAIGDRSQVLALVSRLPSIGGRRGSGEGAVLRWEVIARPEVERFEFAHTHADGNPGRPLPEACVRSLGRKAVELAPAGLRPPTFHPANQHLLVVASEKEDHHAAS